MADPRLATNNHDDTDPKGQFWYKADGVDIAFDPNQPHGSAVVGRAVMLSGHDTVRLTGDGSEVTGLLMKVEPDGSCAVRTRGFARLAGGTGAALTPGSKIVGALLGTARGYIRNVAAAPATYAAATADEIARGRHRVSNAADATSVEVELGV